MNLKKLFLMLTFFVLLGTTAFAQQTWYVNNQTGNDGRNGLSATIPSPDDFVTGPKKTIGGAQGAQAAGVDGDVIVVANTGVAYGVGTGEPSPLTFTKKMTIQSTGGTVTISSLVGVTTGALANAVVFNSGAFNFTGGLTLTSGTLTNSSQLITVTGGTITVAAASTVTKVTGQLLYSGTVNFSYGATYTTADEFPGSGTIGTLTTTAGNLTLETTSAVVTGNITTAGTLNLGGNVLSITTGTAHTFGGNVTNGTLAFTLTGGVTVGGAVTLPTVTATSSNAQTLALGAATAITGSLTVSGKTTVTTSAALATIGTTGFTGDAVVNSGIGTVTLSGTALVVNGNVNLNTSGVTTASSLIVFNGATSVTVNGNVTNQVSLTDAGAAFTNAGLIQFPDVAITITGNVVNNASLTGTVGAASAFTTSGQIQFVNAATNVTINGAINNSSFTALTGKSGGAYGTLGAVTFSNALTTGIVRVDGGINNSSNWSSLAATGVTTGNNGRVIIGGAARTAGSTIGTLANPVGAISNSSSGSANGSGDGDIIIGAGDGTASGFFGTSVSASGSVAGGYITFGNEAFATTGNVVLTRSNTGALSVINIGTGAVTGATVSVGGNLDNQSKNNIVVNVSSTGNVTITGSWNSSVTGGTISFPNLTSGTFTTGGLTCSAGTLSLPVTHSAAVAFGGPVSLSGGTVSLLGTAAATVSVSGSASFTGGAFTTSAAIPTLTLSSSAITIGGATTNTTFPATLTVIVANPSPTSTVSMTIGGFNPSIAGNLQVNNTGGLPTAVTITGGTLGIAGNLTFTAGAVQMQNFATLLVSGNFVNTAGYTTLQQSRITLNGATSTFGGAGSFGNIEFNNGAAGFASSSAVTLAGTIYLTAGTVDKTGGVITVNNATVTPTIVVNAGSFITLAPTFASNVNITYIGTDKATGLELPTSTTKLQNLTVATTQGTATAGQGAVTLGANATVNGTITINTGQALVIGAGFTLTMKGASAVLNGDLANNTTGMLALGRATGTTFTGSGYLPDITVNAGSSGNIFNGPTAMVNTLLGADNIRGGVADFDPTLAAATGSLTFVAGTNDLSINAAPGVAFDGSFLNNITTADAGNTLTLGASVIETGNLTHVAGTINLATFMLTHNGTTPAITGGALITGTGTLKFAGAAKTLSCVTSDVTIGANVQVALTANTTAFIIDPATAGNLIVAGNLTVSRGDVQLGNGGTARNLTVTGSNVSLSTSTTTGTIDVGAAGIGTFRLNATTAPLTLSYYGTPTIARLRISNDVNLAGTGTALTVSTVFTHDGGVLNFGSKNLTFQKLFTRSAGTSYVATTGYMIFDGAAANLAVTQGTDGFSIPNLRVINSGAFDVVLNSGATQGTVTVTGAFDLNNGVTTTQEFTTNDKFAIAGGATVNYTSGTLDAAPAYAGAVTMVGKSFLTGETFPALLWPSTLTVSTLTINGAAAGNTIALPGSRTVGNLNLTKGILTLVANTLTLSSGATVVRTDAGSVTATTGGITFPTDNTTNVTYYANAAGIGSGIELPATLNNLIVSRNTNGANQAVTLATSVAVNGTLTIKNNFTIPATPPVVTVSVNGNLSIVNDAATYALATNPVLTNNQSLVLGGASGDQTITVPAATPALNIGAITVNKASGNVIIAGGNLATGTITFTQGDIITNAFVLYIPAPTTAAVAGGAQPSGFTGASSASMVVGNVAKTLVNTGGIATSTESVNIFPVGTGVVYRPATIIFNPAFGVPTTPNATIVVSHVDSNPGGTQALPIVDGVATGIDVSRYPNFYWNIYTIGSVGQSTVFDLGLTAGNFTDYDSPSNVRIIRRHGAVGDVNNDWLLQGVNTGYDNEVNSTTGFTAINRNSVGGLRTGGAVFTLGVKSNISVKNAIAKQWLVIPQGAKTVSLANVFQGNIGTLSFTAQSSNPAVATAAISGTSVVLTPLTIGEAFVTIKAVDAANNDFFAYTFAIDSRNTDVATTEEIPTEFSLSQNFPNPFNPTTNIKFALPKESNVTLKIYNILGEEVANLVNKVMPAGYHTVNFDATRLASGMYIYRIEAGSFVQVKKMLLMK